jgi:hypothetical protein
MEASIARHLAEGGQYALYLSKQSNLGKLRVAQMPVPQKAALMNGIHSDNCLSCLINQIAVFIDHSELCRPADTCALKKSPTKEAQQPPLCFARYR